MPPKPQVEGQTRLNPGLPVSKTNTATTTPHMLVAKRQFTGDIKWDLLQLAILIMFLSSFKTIFVMYQLPYPLYHQPGSDLPIIHIFLQVVPYWCPISLIKHVVILWGFHDVSMFFSTYLTLNLWKQPLFNLKISLFNILVTLDMFVSPDEQ